MTDTASCPTDELLIGYVAADLTEPEQRQISAHVGTCDRCIATVRVVHARLRVTADPLEAPPAALRARARAGRNAGAESRPVPLLLRLPILIPISLAAGALLMVGVHTWIGPEQPPLRIRAVQIQRTTRETPVHAQPSAQAAVVASLHAGEIVEVRHDQPGWCRVTLHDGREGWIEARAFE